MTDSTNTLCQMVEIMETGVVAREGRHILGPRSKDEQRTVGAGLLAGSIFGLDQYVRNIRKRYQGETDS